MQVHVPVRALQKTSVQGRLTLQDNDVQIMPGVPVLNKTRGVVQFDAQGLNTKGLIASVFGGDAQMHGSLSFDPTKSEVAEQLRLTAVLTSVVLRDAMPSGWFFTWALPAH